MYISKMETLKKTKKQQLLKQHSSTTKSRNHDISTMTKEPDRRRLLRGKYHSHSAAALDFERNETNPLQEPEVAEGIGGAKIARQEVIQNRKTKIVNAKLRSNETHVPHANTRRGLQSNFEHAVQSEQHANKLVNQRAREICKEIPQAKVNIYFYGSIGIFK